MKLVYQSSTDREKIIRRSFDPSNLIPSLGGGKRQTLLRVDLLDSYKIFFGLKKTPFSVSPDPKFFYFSGSHAEALNHLRYGIYEGLGFTMIVGEPGTGKTMLLRYFLSKAGDDLVVTHIPYPHFSQKELLLAVVENLGGSKLPQESITEGKLTEELHHLLLPTLRQSRRVVICLDEAQGMDPECLEGLRLLSNLETESHKLIQIVLFGQPELEQRLKEKNLRQLDQRILVRCRLLPLESEEMRPYLQHQLKVAQIDSQVEFSAQAIDKIYEITKGLPRMVNVVCERAMMSAFTENKRNVTVQNVLEGWESLQGIQILEKARM
jgi:type II secretory pathway predicted ATPase ExeA